MDTVKQSFVSKMRAISQSTQEMYSSEALIAAINLTSACKLMPILPNRDVHLPVRNTFWYTCKQKMFLYKHFKEGESTGTKISPEQVHLKMRKEFSPNEYVTIQQIKSLFSRKSSEQLKGMLKDLKS